MAQYKFTCPHCGKTWFVSSTEIARNKKLAKDISKAETLQKGTLFHGKKYLKQRDKKEIELKISKENGKNIII